MDGDSADKVSTMRSVLAIILLGLLMLTSVGGHAFAQEEQENAAGTEDAEAAPQAPAPAPAPYDGRLLRLAEIVGSIHYLRELCEKESEQDWRQMMQDLIDAEAPESDRRARLTAAFNRGYRSFASVYTRCTAAATAAESRYRSEGATLASEIIARYGN